MKIKYHLIYKFGVYLDQFKYIRRKLNILDEEINYLNLNQTDNFFKDISSKNNNIVHVVFIGLGGKDALNFSKKIRSRKEPNIILISFFPGIMSKHDVSGFYARSASDVILFGSKSLMQRSKKIPFQKNIVKLFIGMNKSIENIQQNSTTDFCFIEQSGIPSAKKDKSSFYYKLFCFFKNNSKHKLTILRKNKDDDAHYEENIDLNYLRLLRLNNVEVVEELHEVPNKTFTFSSAMIIQLLELSKVNIISDYGFRSSFGNDFFKDSNLETRIDKILQNDTLTTIDSSWLNDITHHSDLDIYSIISNISKTKKDYVNFNLLEITWFFHQKISTAIMIIKNMFKFKYEEY